MDICLARNHLMFKMIILHIVRGLIKKFTCLLTQSKCTCFLPLSRMENVGNFRGFLNFTVEQNLNGIHTGDMIGHRMEAGGRKELPKGEQREARDEPLYQIVTLCVLSKLLQLCPTLCSPGL